MHLKSRTVLPVTISSVGLIFCIYAFGQTLGTIKGHVTDQQGRKMPGLTVCAMPYATGFRGHLVSAVTDKDGAFEIRSSVVGQLQVIAYKDDAGYPDVSGVLFTSGMEHFPVTDVLQGQTLNNLNIVLPPPDGILSGKVRDSITGEAVPQARITLRWAESPDVMYSSYLKSDGSFMFALPPRPITIELSAEGRQPWHYVDPKTGSAYVSLTASSKVNLSITLKVDDKTKW